jgi:hypothetical protein
MEFLHTVRPDLASLPALAADVLRSELPSVGETTDLADANETCLAENKDSPSHVLAAARVERMLGGDKANCEKRLLAIPGMTGTTLKEACAALDTLKSWRSGHLDAFKKEAGRKWPEASIFH